MLDLIGGSYTELARQEGRGLPKLIVSMMPGGALMLEAAGLAGRTIARFDRGLALSKRPWPTWLPYFAIEGQPAFALCEEPFAQVMWWRYDAVTRDDIVTFDPERPEVCIQLELVDESAGRPGGAYGDRFWVPLAPDQSTDRRIPGLYSTEQPHDPRVSQQNRLARSLEAAEVKDLPDRVLIPG